MACLMLLFVAVIIPYTSLWHAASLSAVLIAGARHPHGFTRTHTRTQTHTHTHIRAREHTPTHTHTTHTHKQTHTHTHTHQHTHGLKFSSPGFLASPLLSRPYAISDSPSLLRARFLFLFFPPSFSFRSCCAVKSCLTVFKGLFLTTFYRSDGKLYETV